MRPNYLVIEGNIGAGKTTLARRLAREWTHVRLLLETFADNPFLPLFYQDPARHAFAVELFFMAERHRQLRECLARPELFRRGLVADFTFPKTLLFATNSLEAEELRLFRRLFTALDEQFPRPDLLVYLHRPVEVLLENIARRGRPYELGIGAAYLQRIERTYHDYLRTLKRTPVLLLDVGERDLTEKADNFSRLTELLGQEHPPGLWEYRL